MVEADDTVVPGDEAVLLGKQGGEEITIDELTKTAGTIPHEVLCDLKRVPKVWVEE